MKNIIITVVLSLISALAVPSLAYAKAKDCIEGGTCVALPSGATVSAIPIPGAGQVKVTWTGMEVEKVVRFWLVEADPANSAWTSAQSPSGNEVILSGVCESNKKYSFDARFQLKLAGNKWALITPDSRPGPDVYAECQGSKLGCAYQVSESVLQQACGQGAPVRQ